MLDRENNSYSFQDNSEKEVEKFVGIEIYATSKMDGIGGVYKTTFKDFIVKEIAENGKILDIKADQSSSSFSAELKDKYTTFNLIKINKDTFEAARRISKALNIPYRSLYYSGLKDKQSISVQKFSVKGDHIAKLQNLRLRDIFIRNIHPTNKPVKLGSHLGNNFTIIIRNVEDSGDLEQRVKNILKFVTHNGFPNYFGLQRFGNFRPNSHIIGRYLLERDYERAFNEYVLKTYSTESNESRSARTELRNQQDLEKAYDNFPKILQYERKMIQYLMNNPDNFEGAVNTLPSDLKRLLISSFQSYIFNKMLSLRVKKGYSLFTPVEGDVISILDDYNGNVTPVKYIYGGNYDEYLEKALNVNRALIILPIIGTNTNLDDFPLMKSIYKEIIELEGINEDIFQQDIAKDIAFKGSIRAIIAKPTDLKLSNTTDDECNINKKKIRIEFSIQKGSYATMLIRELIK
ncbi:MAG: tRNA pseudouridine(13) synthase TruD [Candidatus Thorarchaeota archaeon]